MTRETEMRDSQAPTPETAEELAAYIADQVGGRHDYGSCVYAMSLAATAAFNYVASKLGVTGMQASCADLDVLRRTRRIKGPFAIIDANNMLYPQCDIQEKVREYLAGWTPWAAKEAAKLLEEPLEYAHPNVIAHWKKLASRHTGGQSDES